MTYTEEAARYAIQRMEDFTSVQITDDKPLEERLEAISILCDSLDLDLDTRSSISAWIDQFVGEEARGPIFMGVLVGLLMADFIHGHPTQNPTD